MAKLVETVTNELSVPLDCSVMLVHHTGKIGASTRGASAPKPLLFDMLTVPIELGK